LIAYEVTQNAMALVSGRSERKWMDETPNKFAYRCLPLVMANQLGWDILSPVRFTSLWKGGINPEDVLVYGPEGIKSFVKPHFGSGVLTFTLNCTFRTDPETELLVTGPFNVVKPGIMPLTGLVESWWLPFTFTMNWKFTHPGQVVVFEKDEPLCRIIPISRKLTEDLRPEIRDYTEQGDGGAEYLDWMQSRAAFNVKLSENDPATLKQGWQKNYFRGKKFDGASVENHRTKLNQREFIRIKSMNPNAQQIPSTFQNLSPVEHSLEIVGTHSQTWKLSITPVEPPQQTKPGIMG